MHKPLPFLTVVSAAGIALSLAVIPVSADDLSGTVPGTIVAADDNATIPEPAPSEGGVGAEVLHPKTYKETPSEVAQCEQTWDPATGMSKQEYEASCKRTLKYFPEKDN